jgi:very-short-patch-repair endonuclease
LNITEYLERYPDSELLCAFTRQNKAKTDAQKQAQSEKLTRRFTTPEGQVTRAQISAASKITAIAEKDARVQRLRKAWEDPQFRLKQAALTKARWESGNLRDAVVRWHRENKELSNTIIANARKCDNPGENLRKARLIQVKTSKLHLAFKVRMLTAGLNSFITESQLGPFRIDEARHDIKVAVEIDGCWWHGCQRCGFTGVRATVANDKSKNAYIATIGWALVRIRECDIKADPDACIAHIRSVIDSATQKGTTC